MFSTIFFSSFIIGFFKFFKVLLSKTLTLLSSSSLIVKGLSAFASLIGDNPFEISLLMSKTIFSFSLEEDFFGLVTLVVFFTSSVFLVGVLLFLIFYPCYFPFKTSIAFALFIEFQVIIDVIVNIDKQTARDKRTVETYNLIGRTIWLVAIINLFRTVINP